MMRSCLSPRKSSESFARSSRSSNRTPRSRSAGIGCRVAVRCCSSSDSIGGLALTIGGLALNFLFAFAGFVLVLVVALMLETELRLLGRERLGQLPISAWLSGRRPSGVDDDATR